MKKIAVPDPDPGKKSGSRKKFGIRIQKEVPDPDPISIILKKLRKCLIPVHFFFFLPIKKKHQPTVKEHSTVQVPIFYYIDTRYGTVCCTTCSDKIRIIWSDLQISLKSRVAGAAHFETAPAPDKFRLRLLLLPLLLPLPLLLVLVLLLKIQSKLR